MVRVTIDGCSKALRASSTMTVEECVDALLRKLCKGSLGTTLSLTLTATPSNECYSFDSYHVIGTVTDQLLTETKHKYKDYWLYAEAPNHTHILLMPSDAAVRARSAVPVSGHINNTHSLDPDTLLPPQQQLASYASSPAPLVFKKAPEYHQRQIMTQLYRREHVRGPLTSLIPSRWHRLCWLTTPYTCALSPNVDRVNFIWKMYV